jgi:hypothetical protein
VLWGDKYDWIYVQRLQNMLQRHLDPNIILNVFCESQRPVPPGFVKHTLQEWPGVSGPRQAWWYKMQMFEPGRLHERVFYFDLDMVICRDISWMKTLDPKLFWTMRDFKYLWKPQWHGINSSVMVWNPGQFNWIWKKFQKHGIHEAMKRYQGDQDYLTAVLPPQDIGIMDQDLIKSWRWQIKDGGMDPRTRRHHVPGSGTKLDAKTCVMVFHGSPKPHEVDDPVIAQHWQ